MKQRESSQFITRYLISEKGNRVHVPFTWAYAANLFSDFPLDLHASVNAKIMAETVEEVNINPLFANPNRSNVEN